MKRKSFISSTGLLLSSLSMNSKEFLTKAYTGYDIVEELKSQKTDDSFWELIRANFNYPKNFIQLENGYFSPQPLSTLYADQSLASDINTRTSLFMRREQTDAIEEARTNLANFLMCDTSEVALTRNTTEALNIVISGYPWKKGDEVIIGNQDYGSMVTAFRQQAKRSGIIIKEAQVPLLPKTDKEVVDAYKSLITPNTKVLHLTHMINLSGQITPAEKIIETAHQRGVEVIVDAAHSVAQVDFSAGMLNADYVAGSLHKWLCCPIGVGFLMMKKKHIQKIWPLMADEDFAETDIRKFEHQGTRPINTLMSIKKAIQFHEAIGGKRKESRLHYLKSYWLSEVTKNPRVKSNTPISEKRSCAIANISVEGFSATELASKLFSDYKIFTVAIEHPAIQGIRVTPHLFTSIDDLDKLIEAIKKIAK